VESETRHRERGQRGSAQIIQCARAMLDGHAHFRGRSDRFKFSCADDVLIVKGSVPSFYLKQLLQSVLKGIEGVRVIENQVQVISEAGIGGGSIRRRAT
jgi:hypothetical protein